MSTMTVSEARSLLPEILERVLAGDEVTLTRHGQPVAVIVRPDTLRSRRAGAALDLADDIRGLLDKARRVPLAEVTGLTHDRADQLVAAVRAGRSKR